MNMNYAWKTHNCNLQKKTKCYVLRAIIPRIKLQKKTRKLYSMYLFMTISKLCHWSQIGSSRRMMQAPSSSSYSSSLSSPSSVSPGHPCHISPPMPPGWQECVSKSTGRTYFWNQHTKKSQWDRPTKSAVPQKLSPVEVMQCRAFVVYMVVCPCRSGVQCGSWRIDDDDDDDS